MYFVGVPHDEWNKQLCLCYWATHNATMQWQWPFSLGIHFITFVFWSPFQFQILKYPVVTKLYRYFRMNLVCHDCFGEAWTYRLCIFSLAAVVFTRPPGGCHHKCFWQNFKGNKIRQAHKFDICGTSMAR